MMRRFAHIAVLLIVVAACVPAAAMAGEASVARGVAVSAVVPSLDILGPYVVRGPFRPPLTDPMPAASPAPRRTPGTPAWGSARIRFAVTRPASAAVLVTDWTGRLVHLSSIPATLTGSRTVYWNGRDLYGQLVVPSWYSVTGVARNGIQTARGSTSIAVDHGLGLSMSAPKVEPRKRRLLWGTMSRAAYVSVRVIAPSGKTVRTSTPTFFPAGTWSWTWDMRDDAGAPVPTGRYTSVVVARDSGERVVTVAAPYLYTPVYVAVGTPKAPKTMKAGSAKPVYGYLKLRHTKGTYPVRIYRYRYVKGKWKSYSYVKAKASNYSTYTKYTARMKLPYRGKWRLRAYHRGDARHPGTWSSTYDSVTVK